MNHRFILHSAQPLYNTTKRWDGEPPNRFANDLFGRIQPSLSPGAAAEPLPPLGSIRTERAMSVNNTVLALAAGIAFAAAVYVAARPETQTISFAMPMTQKIEPTKR
jgi:hypothetical protein